MSKIWNELNEWQQEAITAQREPLDEREPLQKLTQCLSCLCMTRKLQDGTCGKCGK